MATARVRGKAPPLQQEGADTQRPLHRVGIVRRTEGVSLRGVARRINKHVGMLRLEEDPNYDLRLSQLYIWQKALRVPLADLLYDTSDGCLSAPIEQRCRLVRLMKTATAIREMTEDENVARMSEVLIDQLLELMPELDGVQAWPSVGQRRRPEECGRVAEQTVKLHSSRSRDG